MKLTFRQYVRELLSELRGWTYVEMSMYESWKHGGLRQIRETYEMIGPEYLYRNNRPIAKVAMWLR